MKKVDTFYLKSTNCKHMVGFMRLFLHHSPKINLNIPIDFDTYLILILNNPGWLYQNLNRKQNKRKRPLRSN